MLSCAHELGAFLAAVALAVTTASCGSAPANPADTVAPQWGILIHTGAGNFTVESLGEREAPMREAMTAALSAGHAVLARGGPSLDAVEAALVILEDSPHFNAGKGAVFTHGGTNELDASIMDGRTRQAGAVAGLKHVKNPIRLARLVMEKSPHVMMVGDGAEAFAREQGGIEIVDEKYFYTERAWELLQRALEREKTGPQSSVSPAAWQRPDYFGTVGAVALDQQGNLAAATSTGGMTNKRYGRVGDSPIVGAGTYASNTSCAISATGHGEYFIRYTVARDICARVEYQGMSVQAAADAVVQGVLRTAGGEGGVIGMDRAGNIAISLNVSGMGRAYMGADGEAQIAFAAADKFQMSK
jgi:beta-aspartyl-peptidase (threonine type)